MSDFLYPFLEGERPDVPALLADLAASAMAKAADSTALAVATIEREGDHVETVAGEIAARVRAGGRLFTFGNGGSSSDAAAVAGLFAAPPRGRAVPARCLAEDTAVLTALGNDVGFDLVFSRQLIAHARNGDVAIGMSTSGNSRNLLVAFEEACRRGLLTVGLAGYDGGEMAASPHVDHCLVVASDSVHRVQEVQAALSFALWSTVQERLGGDGDG